jgi:hypothetical protein|tara:strand:- start:785 stop:985 length:201 start_codon:yes stop_codon:yes gene_type:complete
MCVGEEHPHIGQFFHRWSMDLLIIRILGEELIGGCVTHAHVICHEEDDIRPVDNLTECKKGKKKKA